MTERDFDVVVFGAGGFTGRQVSAYLAERAAEIDLSWAPAGRTPERVRSRLERDGIEAVPNPIVADVEDRSSLEAMAARARVVLNLVGPYTTYGEPVIEACISSGAHYVDLTGEIPFARRMIEGHGQAAEGAGIKVVEVSGFECLPVDLLTSMVQDALRSRSGVDAEAIDVVAGFTSPPGPMRPSDGLSGGTAQSMAAVIGGERPGLVTDPAALIEDEARAEQVRRRSPVAVWPRRSGDAVLVPMQPAAFINPAVIHRTAAIRSAQADRPAPPFRYREGIMWPASGYAMAPTLTAAAALAAAQLGFGSLTGAPEPIRKGIAGALSRVLPKSGTGPDPERMKEWTWWMTAAATGPGGERAVTRLDADGHPGYLATGRMMGEAGILLREEGSTPEVSGFLTPATALGTDSLDRFARAGLRFSVPD